MRPVSVLGRGDHLAVREGLRLVLRSHPNFQLVALAADGTEAILKAIEEKTRWSSWRNKKIQSTSDHKTIQGSETPMPPA